MLKEFSGIVGAQKGEADILSGILVPPSAGIDQKPGIAVGLVVGVRGEGRTKTFDFKEVVGVKQPGNVFWDGNVRKLMDDEQVDTVVIFAENIFRIKIKKMGIVTQFDLHGADGSFMPVDVTFVHRRVLSLEWERKGNLTSQICVRGETRRWVL